MIYIFKYNFIFKEFNIDYEVCSWTRISPGAPHHQNWKIYIPAAFQMLTVMGRDRTQGLFLSQGGGAMVLTLCTERMFVYGNFKPASCAHMKLDKNMIDYTVHSVKQPFLNYVHFDQWI